LVDCFVPETNGEGPVPSKFAWPQLVANELDMECINMSRPGAGNKEILNTLLDFKFDTTDVVITMWSFINRWCILNEDGSILRLTHTSMRNDPNAALQYDKVFTSDDLRLDFIYRANFAKMFLDNKNLKNYHLTINPPFFLPKVMPSWNNVNVVNINLSLISNCNPKALDAANGYPHPGPEAHRIVATGLVEELSNAHNK
jgi:hypothetical protein